MNYHSLVPKHVPYHPVPPSLYCIQLPRGLDALLHEAIFGKSMLYSYSEGLQTLDKVKQRLVSSKPKQKFGFLKPAPKDFKATLKSIDGIRTYICGNGAYHALERELIPA